MITTSVGRSCTIPVNAWISQACCNHTLFLVIVSIIQKCSIRMTGAITAIVQVLLHREDWELISILPGVLISPHLFNTWCILEKRLKWAKKKGVLHLERNKYSSPDGHLLATVSVNFKFGKLWNKSWGKDHFRSWFLPQARHPPVRNVRARFQNIHPVSSADLSSDYRECSAEVLWIFLVIIFLPWTPPNWSSISIGINVKCIIFPKL